MQYSAFISSTEECVLYVSRAIITLDALCISLCDCQTRYDCITQHAVAKLGSSFTNGSIHLTFVSFHFHFSSFELPICLLHLRKRSFVTGCLNLLACELASTYGCVASCNLSAYVFVMFKIKATYLLTSIHRPDFPFVIFGLPGNKLHGYRDDWESVDWERIPWNENRCCGTPVGR